MIQVMKANMKAGLYCNFTTSKDAMPSAAVKESFSQRWPSKLRELTKKWQFLKCCRLGRPTPAPHRHLEVTRSAWWPHKKTHSFHDFWICWQHVDSDKKCWISHEHRKSQNEPKSHGCGTCQKLTHPLPRCHSLNISVSPKDAPHKSP